MTHAAAAAEVKEKLGISDGLRLSLGCEDSADRRSRLPSPCCRERTC